jgi:hypothetical protein
LFNLKFYTHYLQQRGICGQQGSYKGREEEEEKPGRRRRRIRRITKGSITLALFEVGPEQESEADTIGQPQKTEHTQVLQHSCEVALRTEAAYRLHANQN